MNLYQHTVVTDTSTDADESRRQKQEWEGFEEIKPADVGLYFIYFVRKLQGSIHVCSKVHGNPFDSCGDTEALKENTEGHQSQ